MPRPGHQLQLMPWARQLQLQLMPRVRRLATLFPVSGSGSSSVAKARRREWHVFIPLHLFVGLQHHVPSAPPWHAPAQCSISSLPPTPSSHDIGRSGRPSLRRMVIATDQSSYCSLNKKLVQSIGLVHRDGFPCYFQRGTLHSESSSIRRGCTGLLHPSAAPTLGPVDATAAAWRS